MIIPREDLRGIKKRDKFKKSEEMSEKDFQYWKDWLNKNEKRLIEEIGKVHDE